MVTVLTLLAGFLLVESAWAGEDPTYHIPRVDGVEVDGQGADWADRGFQVQAVTGPLGEVRPFEDLDVRFRLAWDDRGLLVLVEVYDDEIVFHEEDEWLGRQDGIELGVSSEVDSPYVTRVLIAPGGGSPADAGTASRLVDGGYVAEALITWAQVGISAGPAYDLAFRLVVTDFDGTPDSLRVGWHPRVRLESDAATQVRLRLVEEADEPVRARVDRVVGRRGCTLTVSAAPELVGAPYELRAGREVVASGIVEEHQGRGGLRLELPSPAGPAWPAMELSLAGHRAATLDSVPTVGHLLDHLVQAMGGAAALRAHTTRSGTGRRVVGSSPDDPREPPHELVFHARAPDRWVLEVGEPSSGLWQGRDGGERWQTNTDGVERWVDAGPSALSFSLVPGSALLLDQQLVDMVLVDEAGRVGSHVVEAKTADGRLVELYLDPSTGLVTRIGSWFLEQYEPVDGVVLPRRISASSGNAFHFYELDEVHHGAALDDETFTPPSLAELFPDAFRGIDDPRVRPMLEHLPQVHGGKNVPCRDGRVLYDLVVDRGYRRGLEIGTANGYSALWLGLGFRRTGGELITMEIDAEAAEEARGNFERAGLSAIIETRTADALAEIPTLEGPFDLVFLDAWKPDYLTYLELLRDRVVPGGVLVAHNVSPYQSSTREFLQALLADEAFDTTLVDTSSQGLTVSVKKP